MVEKVIKAVFVLPVALVESLTVSFYQNMKKRLDDKPLKNKYVQVKVPEGHQNPPEYRDLTPNQDSSNPSMMDIFK